MAVCQSRRLTVASGACGEVKCALLFSLVPCQPVTHRHKQMIKKLGVLAVILGVLAVLFRKAKSLMGVEDESEAGA